MFSVFRVPKVAQYTLTTGNQFIPVGLRVGKGEGGEGAVARSAPDLQLQSNLSRVKELLSKIVK
jgi:hypothetical protein